MDFINCKHRKMRKIYQLNSELFKVTGIQRVIMDIHEALSPLGAKIVGTIPFEKVTPDLGIMDDDYIEKKGYSMFRNSVVIIHERRFLPVFWVLNKLFRFNSKVVYVHHNELYGQKLLSLFPENVVAISDAGIRNLTEYFGVPHKHIIKIHNCVRQPINFTPKSKNFTPDNITILYPARINSVKQQVEIVRNLRDKLDPRIHIIFAGTGPDYETLKAECLNNRQFVALGYRNDILDLMQQVDFVMLYSKQEGLPISLIEACMTATPIIANDVGGNCEIADNEINAFILNDWHSLSMCLNKLPSLPPQRYSEMSDACLTKYNNDFDFKIFKNLYINLVLCR